MARFFEKIDIGICRGDAIDQGIAHQYVILLWGGCRNASGTGDDGRIGCDA